MYQIVEAFKEMRKKNIVHRDVLILFLILGGFHLDQTRKYHDY